MSAGSGGNGSGPQDLRQLDLLMADKKFQRAVAGYTRIDDDHDVAFLAGSESDGSTIDFDREFAQAIKDGKIKLDGTQFDPTRYICIHEAVEGSILRKQFSPGVWILEKSEEGDNPPAHRVARIAERAAVEHDLGPKAWEAYLEALKPWIKPDEPSIIHNPPPNILRQRSNGQSGEASGGNRLTVIRHGETSLNESTANSVDRIRGWTNVPLDEVGRRGAEATADKLANSGIKIIFASDLKRSHDTAKIIGKKLGIKPIPMKSLRPWDLGSITGKASVESLPTIRKYVNNHSIPIPKGESFDSFHHRAFSGIAEALKHIGKGKVAIVTHHRVERILAAWNAKGQPDDLSVDPTVFTQKGEPPGHVEEFVFKTPIDPSRIGQNRNNGKQTGDAMGSGGGADTGFMGVDQQE